MRSDPAHLAGILFDLTGIPRRWEENFSYKHAQVGQPGDVG